MKRKILIVNMCKELLHYYEFVKPIEGIVKEYNLDFQTVNYFEIKQINLNNSSETWKF